MKACQTRRKATCKEGPKTVDQRADTTTPSSVRIRRLAWWGQVMCAISLAVPIAVVLLSLLSESWRAYFMFKGLQVDGKAPIPMSPDTQRLVILASLPAILCQTFAMWSGWKLFSGYRRGEVFTQGAAKCMTRIGWALLAIAPLGLWTTFIVGKILSEPAQTGGAAVSVPFSAADIDFTAIAFGLMAILIGRVLGEAAKLSEENRLFV
jgi:Protein of unknown function (DUF2975)